MRREAGGWNPAAENSQLLVSVQVPFEYAGLGPTLASVDTRAYHRKKTLCSLLGLGLLRTAQAGEERGSPGKVCSAVPTPSGPGRRWWGHSGSVLSHLMCGRPGAAVLSPTLLPCNTASRALPASKSGHVCLPQSTQDPVRLH